MTSSTQVFATDAEEGWDEALELAVKTLRSGEVVALPTETVYGLAAVASDAEAVAKVYEVKERPAFDPLIVHLPNRDWRGWLTELAVLPEGEEGSEEAMVREVLDGVLEEFWPGPLTVLLPKTEKVSDVVTAGKEEVALRVSAHPVFKKVIGELQQPIAAPSANRFGRVSPTSVQAVVEELGGKIPLVLDGGACKEGLESTIIRVLPRQYQNKKHKVRIQILRAGPVTPEMLKAHGKVVLSNAAVEDEAVSTPGAAEHHYAPNTPVYLLESPEEVKSFEARGGKWALLSFRGAPSDGYVEAMEYERIEILSPGRGKLVEAGVRFFYALRLLDTIGVDGILAEPIPERGLGVAMMERLHRASVKHWKKEG